MSLKKNGQPRKSNKRDIPVRDTFNGEEVKECLRNTADGVITYPGYYCTKSGKIIGIKGNYLKPLYNKRTGYNIVRIRNQFNVDQSVHIHEIICNTWNKIRPEYYLESGRPGYIVDHIDNDRHNNHADNLRWVTWSDSVNNFKNIKRELDFMKREIVATDYKGVELGVYKSSREAAKTFNVDPSFVTASAKREYKPFILYKRFDKISFLYASNGDIIQTFTKRQDAMDYAKKNKLTFSTTIENSTFFKVRFHYRFKDDETND